MTDQVPASAQLARAIVSTLVNLDVTQVVLSPGSRSAGLALALAQASRVGELRLRVVLDERGAGFHALGWTKATGSATAVVTTSGTAAANLAPAIAEAHHSSLALLAITADRPVSLHGSGSNQTTQQVGLFGDLPLATIRLASESGGPQAWTSAVQRAVLLATGVRTRQPGPVHLNVELAEPLLHPSLLHPLDHRPPPVVGRSLPSPSVRLETGPRTVVIAGDAKPPTGAAARAFAESARLPLLAEPSSHARSGECAIARYRDLLEQNLFDRGLGEQIERVVLFGHPTLSRPVSRLLRRGGVEVVQVASTSREPDPSHQAHTIVDAVVLAAADDDWLERWRRADAAAAQSDPAPAWSARSVAETVWRSCSGQQLVLGSSNGIRHLDVAPITADPPIVWANRGLAGIDGTLHTAAGIAEAADTVPVTVLLGDLTFLHDLTGLVHGDRLRGDQPRTPLRIVVIDDHGGAIFHGLEQGGPDYATHFERVFATPQEVDLVAVAQGLGVNAVRVEDPEALTAALADWDEEHQRETTVIVASVSRGR